MNRARAVVVKEIDVGVSYAAVDTVNFFGQFRIGLDIQCFQDGYRIVRADDPPFPDTLDQACIGVSPDFPDHLRIFRIVVRQRRRSQWRQSGYGRSVLEQLVDFVESRQCQVAIGTQR